MPPKASKKDEKGKEEAGEQDDGAERELVEKELVIGYLKNKLGRYQEHGDQLQVENIKLTEDLEAQKLNLRDINEFLTNELKARSLTTSALESKVFELTSMLEDVKKNHEAALGKLRAEKDKELDAVRQTLSDYDKKAKVMQDFLDCKDNLENEVQRLTTELASKVKEYEHKLTDLDRSHIQDREKWKRETMQKIKETKIQMMKLTDNQLEMTTKRTIMENEQMSIELHYQSRQTEKMLNKNTLLMEENQDLRRQLSLSKQTQEELARRNNVYQKTIKSLLAKLQEQGDMNEKTAPLVKELEEHAADLELSLRLGQLQAHEQRHQMDLLQSRLESARAAAESVTSGDMIVRFLAQCLDDVRTKIVTVTQPQLEDPAAATGALHPTPEIEGTRPAQSPRHSLSVVVSDPAGSSSTEVSPKPRASGVLMSRAASSRLAPGASRPASSILPELSVSTGRLEDLSLDQRERVLAYLLDKMHVHMQHQVLGEPASLQPTSSHPLGNGSSSARYGRRASMRVTQTSLGQLESHRSGQVEGSIMTRASHASRHATSPARTPSMASAHTKGAGGRDLASSAASPSASWPAAGGATGVDVAAGGEQGLGGQSATGRTDAGGPLQPTKPALLLPGQSVSAPLPMPGVEDLLTQVMADVRPWGKKAADSPIVNGTGIATGGRPGGVFVKRPNATSSPRMM